MRMQTSFFSLCKTWMWFWVTLASFGALAQDSGVNSIGLRTHSISPPYLDSDMQSRWFDFGGDTVVRADKYIRLAADRPSESGYLFSKVPLTATNWEIEIEFRISGMNTLYGDGLAMWLTKQRATQGPVFGSVDRFEGLGVFIDTYKNNRPGVVFPYVMAMLGDGSTAYNGDNDGQDQELDGCSARGIRNSPSPTKAKLTYFQDQNLTLELMFKSDEEWTPCFDIPNVKIPSVAYLGFSAHTGELSDNFDIISVETKNLYNTSPAGSRGRQPQKGKSYDPNKEPSGSWSWFFLKVVLFLVICGGGYIGFTWYRSNRRSSRF